MRILRCLNTGVSYSARDLFINILYTFVLHRPNKVKEERKILHKIEQ
jgi:hypothetical protein